VKFEDKNEFFFRTLKLSLICGVFSTMVPCFLFFLINKFDSIIF